EQVVGAGSSLRYIAAGDSTGVGQGASSAEKTYPVQVLQELSRSHTVTYKNVAVSGAQTNDLIQSQLLQILAYRPDVVTISIGANDAIHLVSPDKTIRNIQAIVEKILAETTATVYLANVPNFGGGTLLPWYYISLLELRNARINTWLLSMRSDRLRIVNVHDTLTPEHSVRSETFAADGFHPNDAGYVNWTAAFLAAMQTTTP
ncbi:MAG: hypothetical protein KBD66_02135, partial [Candidatus Doudnabacteria bacterium]|nr:hypothetical protein [Candidatus Doudnabacteria bacterium]